MSTRKRFLAIGPALVAAALGLAVVTRDNGPPAGREPGPTVEAQARDLTTTLTATGTLQRASERTVAHTAPPLSDPETPPATLTSVLGVGTPATRGTVLYSADAQPAVVLIGALPAWRSLAVGVDAGVDVLQLEENLVALGHGAGLTVDTKFTSATAAAVLRWEKAQGRTAPDGEVRLGDVIFLASPGDVLGHEAAVGDPLETGAPVLTVGAAGHIVAATVEAVDAGGWTAGAPVDVEWADTTTSAGTVVGTGRDVTDGQVELTVAVDAGAHRTGVAATVTLADTRRTKVVAVPVATIVDNDGEPAVRIVVDNGADSGADNLVPVETGLVAGGWIEITAGVAAGDSVRRPG